MNYRFYFIWLVTLAMSLDVNLLRLHLFQVGLWGTRKGFGLIWLKNIRHHPISSLVSINSKHDIEPQ